MLERDAAGASAGAQAAPVLVVDPDVDERRLVAAALGRAGLRTKLVASGEQAIEEARRERPQLVILEVRLDDISGYEVCRALREEFGEGLGIIFVSGDRKEASDRVAGLLIGADDYLGKPVAGDELVARVIAVARRAGAFDQVQAPAPRAGLTARELEVLQLLADGHNQRAIAYQRGLHAPSRPAERGGLTQRR